MHLIDFITNFYTLYNPVKQQNVYMGFTDCIYNATIPGFAVSEFGFHTDQRR
jgi:hypothetical protein